jgi:hypothetical protein
VAEMNNAEKELSVCLEKLTPENKAAFLNFVRVAEAAESITTGERENESLSLNLEILEGFFQEISGCLKTGGEN